MKRISLLSILTLLFFSCLKDDDLPVVETITKGSKWGIQIGSPSAEVFGQLQQLGSEKGFSEVAVVYRGAFSKPEEIQHHLHHYHAINLQKDNTGTLVRTIIEFRQDKVNSIRIGGAHQDEVDQWPQNTFNGAAIAKGDTINELYQKLLAIYQLPGYGDYSIILPDKPLDKSFDPDMGNFNEWAFSFSVDAERPGRSGISSVRLYFKNGRLDKIRHTYNEADVYS